jgi:plasmid stabilization system protein ParE
MTYRVELTERAKRDLRYLYRRIDAGGSPSASAWFNGLETVVISLGEYPARCPFTPERKDLRHMLYGAGRYVYRVIFRIDEQERRVAVLHIRHGSRKPISGLPGERSLPEG